MAGWSQGIVRSQVIHSISYDGLFLPAQILTGRILCTLSLSVPPCSLFVRSPNLDRCCAPLSPACFKHTRSQQPLPRQLDLPGRLPGLEPSLRNADALTVRQLELVLVAGPCAGAVVWEVHTRERVWAEVVLAVGCYAVVVSLATLNRKIGRKYLCQPVTCTRRSRKGRSVVAAGGGDVLLHHRPGPRTSARRS